ncbi:hypothetical protein KY284_013759 [Solanum tuberosum]|nr:hypothetical protein KY284_013759 [Solanum tuberosum]
MHGTVLQNEAGGEASMPQGRVGAEGLVAHVGGLEAECGLKASCVLWGGGGGPRGIVRALV